ncbi:MAG: hypothetical protein OXR67_05035 [Chloroflexota bacterium]|nr:hypothetical protein [Chloroflexota bacterium]
MFLIFLLILSIPVVLASGSGLVFSFFMPKVGKKWAMSVGAGMGVAFVGAGFGFISAIDEITITINPICRACEEAEFSPWEHRMSYFWERHQEAILFGTYAAAIVLGMALTGLACFLRKRGVMPPPGK